MAIQRVWDTELVDEAIRIATLHKTDMALNYIQWGDITGLRGQPLSALLDALFVMPSHMVSHIGDFMQKSTEMYQLRLLYVRKMQSAEISLKQTMLINRILVEEFMNTPQLEGMAKSNGFQVLSAWPGKIDYYPPEQKELSADTSWNARAIATYIDIETYTPRI